jgi:hypothetical protein
VIRMTVGKMLALACLMCCTMGAGAEESCRAASGNATAGLIELYTSEGCDSCPPADRWMSQIDRTLAGRNFTALAYHVDYWDRLGWKDRFGSPAFTTRQREQTERQHGSFVYTPQVAVQGRDYRSWPDADRLRQTLEVINKTPAHAAISMQATRNGRVADIVIDARVDAEHRRDASLTVALTQNGLVSEVLAGENAGKRLAHDRVVRTWRSGLTLASGSLRDDVHLELPTESGAVNAVAFIEDLHTGEILQTLQLSLCDAQGERK